MEITLLAGVLIVAGLVGIVVPVLPGLLLSWSGVLVWALSVRTTGAWVVLGIATAILIAGTLVKYLVPGRALREAGVPWSSLGLGTLLGILGFVVIPVLGLFIGFVAGVYLGERVRLDDNSAAWPSTVAALKAVGVSMLIELLSGLLIALTWAAGLILT
ncbi:MAG: DUF456 domain-containing protein [Kineosporiaceae bacterium]|nr:DUF456 domain-containing protein [Kineosporiaceae bacterium]